MEKRIQKHTMADIIATQYEKQGLTRKDAEKKAIMDIENMAAPGMDPDVLKVLKEAFFKTTGRVD